MSWNPFNRCANLWCFLFFFCLCYFLETITFTYLVSAVQSIERQFEIPSRMSGSLVAASDIGYVITVVFLAYLGSRGNRARWIGGGCLLIAVACFVVALPHFVFPPKAVEYNHQELLKGVFEPLTQEQIRTPHEFLKTIWGKRLPPFLQDYLNESGNSMTNKDKYKEPMPTPPALTTPLPVWTTPFDDNEEGDADENPDDVRGMGSGQEEIEIYKAKQRVVPPLTAQEDETKKISKRQATHLRDPMSDRMRSAMEEAVMGYYWGFDNYTVFANRLHNITNNKMIPDRIVASAGLPFGFCRNGSMIVKRRMQQAKCKQQEADSGNSGAFIIVFIGIMFFGVGHSMPWTLGMPMIDDHVKKQKTPYYFAGIFFVRILGPVVGFMLGAICSKLYVTLKSPPPGITPLDPRWIGAWWLGFLVVFATLTVPSIILMLFPKIHTKQSARNDAAAGRNRTPQQAKNGEKSLIDNGTTRNNHFQDEQEHVVHHGKMSLMDELRGFGSSIAQCLRSPVYTGALIGRLFDAFAFKGYFVFKPKYLENHYGLTQFKSSMYMGIMGVVGFAGGVVIGSLLMRKARLEGRKAAAYVGFCSMIAAALAIGQTFLGCHSVVNQIGQVGTTYGNNTHPSWPSCYGCSCEGANLYPVCAEDGTPYYSPCHAGCTNFTVQRVGLDVNFDFAQCSCVSNGTRVSRSWCKDDCQQPLIIYLVFSTIAGIISGSAVIPGVLIVMRSVPKEHRSLALGFSAFIVSLISTFPSPPVYGLIIDTACIVWNTACGGARGSCQIYDPTALRQRVYIFHGGLRVLGLLFDIWVWFYAKNLKLMEEDDEQQDEETTSTERRRRSLLISPSFAKEIENEVKGMQVDSDVLARKLSI